MKIFHKKFLHQEQEYKSNPQNVTTENKIKPGYLVPQFLIWMIICAGLFLVFKFVTANFN